MPCAMPCPTACTRSFRPARTTPCSCGGPVGVGSAGAERVSRADFAFWSILAGIIVFAGSLYALALTGIGWLGAITPIGGGLLIAGWLAAAWAGLDEMTHRT